MNQDIRWQQRFSNYRKALKKLTKAVEIIRIEKNKVETISDIDEILQEGLIQRFEYTHELAWNVMKDYVEYQGNFTIRGSRDATREAFKMQLIKNAETWMDMIKSRKESLFTYNQETTQEIFKKVINEYHIEFKAFEMEMEELRIGKKL